LHLPPAQRAPHPPAQGVGALPAVPAWAFLPLVRAGALLADCQDGLEELSGDDRFVCGFVGVWSVEAVVVPALDASAIRAASDWTPPLRVS